MRKVQPMTAENTQKRAQRTQDRLRVEETTTAVKSAEKNQETDNLTMDRLGLRKVRTVVKNSTAPSQQQRTADTSALMVDTSWRAMDTSVPDRTAVEP